MIFFSIFEFWNSILSNNYFINGFQYLIIGSIFHKSVITNILFQDFIERKKNVISVG